MITKPQGLPGNKQETELTKLNYKSHSLTTSTTPFLQSTEVECKKLKPGHELKMHFFLPFKDLDIKKIIILKISWKLETPNVVFSY